MNYRRKLSKIVENQRSDRRPSPIPVTVLTKNTARTPPVTTGEWLKCCLVMSPRALNRKWCGISILEAAGTQGAILRFLSKVPY